MQIIPLNNIKTDKVLRVAAYCRVSTDTEEQKISYDSQKEHFTETINSTRKWKFAGIYADLGRSGLRAEERPEFLRMIEDAKSGLIDIILCKSISRFARNSIEAKEYAYLLKECGVEVRFEREALSTLDPHAEMVFNFLTAVAEEESRSISENNRWTYEKLAKQGIRHLGNNRVLGYDEIEGVLTPNEQAWIPKLIFEEYAAGKPVRDIIKSLKERGAGRLRSSTDFDPRTVGHILENEIFVGDRLLQKQPHNDFKTRKPEQGIPYNSYFISDNHRGIVSREVWYKAQERRRKEAERKEKGIIINYNTHFLYGRLICGECGDYMTRKIYMRKSGPVGAWVCRDRVKGTKGNGCRNRIIRESILLPLIETHIPNASDSDKLKTATIYNDGRIEIQTESEYFCIHI